MTVVLDSWAIMRLLEGAEPAASRVQAEIDAGQTVMSWINLGEIFYVLARSVGLAAAQSTVTDIENVVDVRLPDRKTMIDAATIKALHPMSYADAFAAATAARLRAPLWTGDPELLVAGAVWTTFNPGDAN
ncbi:MAG: PIN domain-containing protein [Terrimesophilobacter sp.]